MPNVRHPNNDNNSNSDTHADHEYYAPRVTLDQRLKDQLARTPWWMISVAAHAAGAAVLYFVMAQMPHTPPPIDVDFSVAEAPPEEIEDPPKRPEDTWDNPIEKKDTPIEDPLISDDTPSDHTEMDTSDPSESTAGKNDEALSNKPFSGESWNTAIGLSGGLPGGRTGPGGRQNRVRTGGGSEITENRAAAGLRWLARHQATDGSFSCNDFGTQCEHNLCDGAGSSADYTPGTTALAVLAFLADGNTTRHGRYKEVVKRGLRHLVSIQTPDGCVGPKVADGHYIYNHAIATMALAEGYGMSGQTPMLKRPAQQAVTFLLDAQNPYLGWRYGIRPGDNDTSITGWAVLALKAAKLAELDVSPVGFVGARQWVEKVTDDSYYKTGYTQKGDNGARLPEAQQYQATEAMTAAGLTIKLFSGSDRKDPDVRGAAQLLANQPPRWDPEAGNDFYYWYYGTLAMFQVGGNEWKSWNDAMKKALVETQHQNEKRDEFGSWDPNSAWGTAGGRVYATAINTLTLQVYYRHQRTQKRRSK